MNDILSGLGLLIITMAGFLIIITVPVLMFLFLLFAPNGVLVTIWLSAVGLYVWRRWRRDA